MVGEVRYGNQRKCRYVVENHLVVITALFGQQCMRDKVLDVVPETHTTKRCQNNDNFQAPESNRSASNDIQMTPLMGGRKKG